MYRASMKLQPSRNMYPRTPVTTMMPSARRAFRTRRTVVCNSYVFETGKRLLGFARPDSAMEPTIATPQRDTGVSARPIDLPALRPVVLAKIVREDEPDACTGL